jgi:hypothetical protein
MAGVNSRHLCDLTLYGQPNDLGRTPYGKRRIVQVVGGVFEGARLRGEVLPVGADVALIRDDGVFDTDVNLVLRTHDGELIRVTYRGRFHGSESFMRKVVRREQTDDDGEFYLWNAVFFETASQAYAWLNRLLAVSTGLPLPHTERGIGMRYEIFELL